MDTLNTILKYLTSGKMLNSPRCIFLFALYISGIHTISKPLDTVNINLNIDESQASAYPPATPTPTAGGASLGGEQAAGNLIFNNSFLVLRQCLVAIL